MSKTSFSTSDDLTKKAWEEKVFRDVVKESFFSPWMGNSSDSVVQVKTQLEKGRGDKINFGLRMRLSGSGVTSGAVLEGQEEALSKYADSVTLEQYRHAVRDDGEMSRQRSAFSIDEESEQAIKDWGSEKVDQIAFDAIFTSPSKIFYKTSAGVLSAAAATAKAALTAADSKLTPAMISWIKHWAKTGGARTYVPLRPIKVKGKDYYVLLIHPDVAYDLKVDSTYAQAQRDAQDRGSDNPIFTGALGVWDGVVIHTHENCPIATDGGGASVAWAKGKLLGAQALCWAWGKRPRVIQKKFDYDNENAFAISMIMGAKAPIFNSLTYGSVELYNARSNVSA